MTVFLGFILAATLTGIMMRHRPFYQSQLVLAGIILVVTIAYFSFGML